MAPTVAWLRRHPIVVVFIVGALATSVGLALVAGQADRIDAEAVKHDDLVETLREQCVARNERDAEVVAAVERLGRRIGAADEDVAPLVAALAPRNCAGLFPGGEP